YVEDRFVARVDLDVPADPCPHRLPPVEFRRERIQHLGRRAQLAGDLLGEMPEDVLLAGEVLVEGDARAGSELRDPLDAAAVVSLLTEGLQRGVEDALLRPLPPGPDLGIVGERSPANHRDGTVEAPISLVVDHLGSLRRLPRRGRRDDTTVSP